MIRFQALIQRVSIWRGRRECGDPASAPPPDDAVHKWVISPESSRFKVWRGLSTFSAVCHAWCVPAMSHFDVPSTSHVSLIFHLTWAILIIDLCVCALTAATDRDGNIITKSIQSCVGHYFRNGRGIIDAVGLLPLNVLFTNSFHYLNRVLVLFRVWWWFKRLNNRVMSMYALWAVKAVVTLILGVHYFACAWWVVGKMNPSWRNGSPSWSERAALNTQWKAVLEADPKSVRPSAAWAPLWFRQYTVSLYWVVNMALIPEASHFSVQSFQERWLGKVIYVVAQMYIAWIGSSLTSVLANTRAVRAAFQRRAEVIMDFLQTTKLPRYLRKRVKQYLNLSWFRNRGVDTTTLLDDLPSTIRAELALKAYGHLLASVPLFSGADEAFFRALSLALRPILFLEGEDIVRQGDLGAEMFALLRGRVHIISVCTDGSEKILSTLQEGAYFGEISLYLSRPRTVTVRAATAVDILVLTKQSLDAVLKLYPDVHSRIVAMAQERLHQDAQRSGTAKASPSIDPQVPPVELEPASVVRQAIPNRRQSILALVAPRNVPFPAGETLVASRSRRTSQYRTVDIDDGSSNQQSSRSPSLQTPSGSPIPTRRQKATGNRPAGAAKVHHYQFSVAAQRTRSFKSLPRNGSDERKPGRSTQHLGVNHHLVIAAVMNALQADTFHAHQSQDSVVDGSHWFSASNIPYFEPVAIVPPTARQSSGSSASEFGHHSQLTISSKRATQGHDGDGRGPFTQNPSGGMEQLQMTARMSLDVPRSMGSFASSTSQWSASRMSTFNGSQVSAHSSERRGSYDTHFGSSRNSHLSQESGGTTTSIMTASGWTGSTRSMQTIATASSTASQARPSQQHSGVANAERMAANQRRHGLNQLLRRNSTASYEHTTIPNPQQPFPLSSASLAPLPSRRASIAANALSVVAEGDQEEKRVIHGDNARAAATPAVPSHGSLGTSINVSLDFLFLDIAPRSSVVSQVSEGSPQPQVQIFHSADSEDF